jgi:hypothetical protein
MRRKIPRFLFGLTLGAMIVLMTVFNVALIWVATGPREIKGLTPYIESSLAPEGSGLSLSIEQALLIWGGWRHPVDVRLSNVTVKTKEGTTFSTFPQISVGLDVFSLLRGKILPRTLTVDKPVVSLYQDEQYHISFGPQDIFAAPAATPAAPQTLPFTSLLAPLISPDDSNPLRKLRRLEIRDAAVSIGNLRTGVFFEAHGVALTTRRSRNGLLELEIDAKARYSEYQSTLAARFLLDKRQPKVSGYVEFKGVEARTLAQLFTGTTALDPLYLPISGSSNLTLDASGALDRMQFKIEGGDGVLNLKHMAKPLNIDWAHAEGQLSNNFQDVQINSFTASMGGILWEADGVAMLADNDVAARGNVILKNISTEKVPDLWPADLAPMSREWVIANITGGSIPRASLKANIDFGDLAKPVLPREAIDAGIELDKVSILYLPDHPPAKNVSALLKIDAITLAAAISAADYMDATKITNANVLIDDLNVDNPYIKVNLEAESSAKNIARFLGLPRLRHAEHLGIKEKEIEGTVKGNAEVGFNFFAPRDAKGNPVGEAPIDYDVKAQMSRVSQNGFMGKFDVKEASGQIAINNSGVEYTGKGDINGADARDLHVTYKFTPENGFDTFIEAKTFAPVTVLPRFGYPALPFLSGAIAVDASVKLGGETEIAKATIDLTDAALVVEEISWRKPAKEAATLTLATEKKGGAVNITGFHAKAEALDIKGSARLARDLSGIEQVEAQQVTFGQTRLSRLLYQTIDGGYRLEAKGDVLDMSGYFAAEDAKAEGDFSFAHFPAVQINVDIDRIIVGKDREVKAFKGTLACDKLRCGSADISGITGDKPFNVRILRNPKGTRQISLRAQDAGAFLQAFNVVDSMQGGDLTLTGNYDDSGAASLLKGRADLSEYVLKDAPVLAKILSVASLTGFFDTLQGKGITFAKMTSKFTLQNDMLTLEKTRTYGPAIGMTIEGTITMPKALLDLEGTIVPSYTLNSALGKVPLVGDLLMGGKGEGIFAARYSVKGTEKDPKVAVNPLSILTPGFLRGLFDVMDKPKQDEE